MCLYIYIHYKDPYKMNQDSMESKGPRGFFVPHLNIAEEGEPGNWKGNGDKQPIISNQ